MSFTYEEWPTKKIDPPVSTCFGNVPVLQHNGKVIAQSRAVVNYAAELAHVKSSNPQHAAFEAMLLSTSEDLKQIMLKCMFGDEESKKKAKEGLQDSLAKFLVPLERMMPDKGFLHARKTSIRLGDIII